MSVSKKTKITIGELNNKLALIESNIPVNVNDQLTYFIKKLFKKVGDTTKTITEKLQEDIQDLQVKYASVDNAGLLLLEGDKYKFTPENQALLNAGVRQLRKEFNNQIIEFDVILVGDDCPRANDIDLFVLEELRGILFEAA